MTEDRMALVELLQKSGESDFLRAVAEAVLQILMEADVEGHIGGRAGAPKEIMELRPTARVRHDHLAVQDGFADTAAQALAHFGEDLGAMNGLGRSRALDQPKLCPRLVR